MMQYWEIVKKAIFKFIDDDAMTYSASIAFYTIFSLPAIFIISMTIGSALYSDDVVRETLLDRIAYLSGAGNAAIVQRVMANAQGLGTSIIAKMVGVGTLLFSATTVFASLQTALNTIWNVEVKPDLSLWDFLISRLISLSIVISIGFLLLASLITDTVIVVFNNVLTQVLSGGAFYIVSVLHLGISLFVLTLVFAMIFKILPDARIEWRDVWKGALASTLLFTLEKYLIGFDLGNSSLSNAYGAAGSLVILLLWIYYSTIILLLGAEFTYVYSQKAGRRIEPEKEAVAVDKKKKEKDVVA